MRQNVGKWERLASLAAGAGLLYFMRHRMRGRTLMRMLGGALLFRGASGYCPISAAAGYSTAGTTDTREALGGSRGAHVRETIVIDRPVAEVFEHWRNLENLPRFMRHLEQVRMFADGRSHWIARGPAGMRVEWDAETI
ncbi:MAG TPA: YgaP-like transmembrane domain, partial [Vicinamibacterales bacterium]